MKRLAHISILVFAVVLLAGCFGNSGKADWSPTLGKAEKKPYGTYLARQSLPDFFPDATVADLSRSSRFSTIDEKTMYNNSGTSMMILTGLTFNISDKEWVKLQEFVRAGNELVVFASYFDDRICDAFHIQKAGNSELNQITDIRQLEANRNVLTLAGSPSKKYGYSGRTITGFFGNDRADVIQQYLKENAADTTAVTELHTADSQVITVPADATAETETTEEQAGEQTEDYSAYTGDDEESTYLLADTLGYANGKPNCLRVRLGRGHITLHAAPLVTSNYFLLQSGNIEYLAGLWRTFPKDVTRIYWDDYYMHSGVESSSNILWQFASTRNGIFLAFLVGGVYLLMHLKRRQRIIPIVAPLRNDTVSFVETVGRLYYNKGNNANLAEKMVQQFLEWVRITCHLNTSQLNEEFVRQLAARSGQPVNTVQELVHMIHEVRLGGINVDDPYLYQLYRTIQEFYKNHRK